MTCPSIPLTGPEIAERLKALSPGWRVIDNALERTCAAETYLGSLALLDEIARLSEAADHHPDLLLSWKRLTIRYWTHTANGLTALDFELAAQVDAVLATRLST